MDEKEKDALFEKILDTIKDNLSESATKKWISPLKIQSVTDEIIEFAAPNILVKDWINDKYLKFMEFAVTKATQKNLNINIMVKKSATQAKEKETVMVGELFAKDAPTISTHTGIEWPKPISLGDPSTLIDKYTFETFVTGKSNKLAHAAAVACAQKPGEAYNPFFMYGNVGLGKTHLMHAIGHAILAKNPEMRVLYVSSEIFAVELIDAIKNNELGAFRKKYHTLDVLMVDDIELLCGKEGTQDAILSTFKTLLESNRQIIISSDCPPKKIKKLNEHLLARLEGGLIVDIQPPDFDLRVAILKKKAQMDGINISDDVIAYIANHIDSNIFKLLGALSCTVSYASLNNQSITNELADDVLKNIFMELETSESAS